MPIARLTTRGTGKFQASETHRGHFSPRYIPGTRKGVLAFYGLDGTADLWYNTAEYVKRLDAIAQAGFPIAACATNADWGNSTFRTRASNLVTFAQSTLGFASGKVHLYGISMGAPCALNWAKANPTLVQSISIILPCVDLADIQDNDRGGVASGMTTAFGGDVSSTDNPALNTNDFTSIPMKLWYASDDDIAIASTVEDFGAATGADLVNMGAVGHHGETTAVDPDSISLFFSAND